MSDEREGIVKIGWGNELVVGCQGEHNCGGRIRIPFTPGINTTVYPEATKDGMIWKRESGETLEDITLSPSIDAGDCGHFHVIEGKIVKS